MKIDKFNKTTCDTVGGAAMEALKVVAEEHGLLIKKERGSYSHDGASYNFKVTFKTVSETGAPSDFAPSARLYGLPEDCWHAELDMREGRCRIVGFSHRARKFKVLTEKVPGPDSCGFSYAIHDVRKALELEKLRAEAEKANAS